MQKVKRLVAAGWFYVHGVAAIAAGAGVLVVLASVAVFLLAGGAVVVTAGFLREELAYLGSLLRGDTGAPR